MSAGMHSEHAKARQGHVRNTHDGGGVSNDPHRILAKHRLSCTSASHVTSVTISQQSPPGWRGKPLLVGAITRHTTTGGGNLPIQVSKSVTRQVAVLDGCALCAQYAARRVGISTLC